MIAIAQAYARMRHFEKAWTLANLFSSLPYSNYHRYNSLLNEIFDESLRYSGLEEFSSVERDELNILKFVFNQLSGSNLNVPIAQHINDIPELTDRLKIYLYLSELYSGWEKCNE